MWEYTATVVLCEACFKKFIPEKFMSEITLIIIYEETYLFRILPVEFFFFDS